MPLTVETFATFAEAARAYEAARSAHFFGGGTILMRQVNEADASVRHVIRTTDPALNEIRTEGAAIILGAGVTMAALAKSRDAAFLAPVARVIGGPQVRSAATVAGNLFAKRPYGDLAGALLALSAVVETGDGRRQSLEEILEPSSKRVLVRAIRVPDPRGTFHFKKVTRVKPKGVSLMSIAVVLPRQGGRVDHPRIVFNGMGPRPVRSTHAERALHGHALDASAITRAAEAAAEGLDPPEDALASAWYRREVAGVHLRRLLETVR